MKKAPGRPEKAVETAIRLALLERGVWVQKHHVDNRQGARTGLGVGVPDLLCIVPGGRWLAIEVKAPGKKHNTSAAQRRWAHRARMFGAVVGVATSVEEALALLEEVPRG